MKSADLKATQMFAGMEVMIGGSLWPQLTGVGGEKSPEAQGGVGVTP